MLEAEIEISSKQTHWPILVNHWKLVAIAELIHLIQDVENIAESTENAGDAKLSFLENQWFAFFKGIIAEFIIRL